MKKKQTNAVILGLGWMVSLGVVFILGILSAFAIHLGPGASEGAASDLNLDQREMLLTIERYAGEPGNIAEIMAVGSGDDLPEQVQQALRGIMRETDPERRHRASRQMVAGLPSRRVMTAIKFLQEIPAGPGRDQLLDIFLESWARADGRRAMAFAASLSSPSERGLATRAVLSGWSQVRPVEAWDWVLLNAGGGVRGLRWMEIVFSQVSSANRETAFSLMQQTRDPAIQEHLGGVVMTQILENSTPREAMAWLTEFPAGAVRSAILELVIAWTANEPWAAADWVYKGFPQASRAYLMDAVAEEWIASEGPGPLAEWLNNRNLDASLDGAIRELAAATAEVDPATALGWAQFIQDADERSMLEIMIGRLWIRIDPDGAAAQLPDLIASESARAALLEPEYYPEEEEMEINDQTLYPADDELVE
jgi:hypothetical protein